MGADKLGSALAMYGGLRNAALSLGIFDNDPKISQKVDSHEILPVSRLEEVVTKSGSDWDNCGTSRSQDVADTMVKTGLKAI